MLFAAHDGELELRKARDGSKRLRGKFPYGKVAVLSDGGRTGRPQKEVIAPEAFSYRVNKPEEEIHLLVGHSFDRPLASRSAGTLLLVDTAAALTFEAIITPETERISWVQDILAAIAAGLIVGLSPGFRIPPKRAVPVAETIEDEPVKPQEGMHGAVIRTVLAALLYEISLVTRPAYDETQVELRDWRPGKEVGRAALHGHLNRWRL